MTRKATNKYTAVRHSAFGYAGDTQFSGGLESRPVHTNSQEARVTKAGGVLFDEYGEAEDFCDFAMYTATGVTGLIPTANKAGTFSAKKLDGLDIYVPKAATMKQFRADAMAPIPRSDLKAS